MGKVKSKITLCVAFPNRCYTPTARLPIEVKLVNNSSVIVEKITFAIFKTVTYHSSDRLFKEEVQKVLIQEVQGLNKKTEQDYQLTIDVPATASTQTYDFHIHYALKVEAKLSAFYKNVPTIGILPIMPPKETPVVVSNKAKSLKTPRLAVDSSAASNVNDRQPSVAPGIYSSYDDYEFENCMLSSSYLLDTYGDGSSLGEHLWMNDVYGDDDW